MTELVRREFDVETSMASAWALLGDVGAWPSWARHIKRSELSPPGQISAKANVSLRLNNGINSTFEVVEFQPGTNWKWRGRFLWMELVYDHRFIFLKEEKTRLIWIVQGEGAGITTLGKLFAWQYHRILDTAVPRLQAEMAKLETPEPLGEVR